MIPLAGNVIVCSVDAGKSPVGSSITFDVLVGSLKTEAPISGASTMLVELMDDDKIGSLNVIDIVLLRTTLVSPFTGSMEFTVGGVTSGVDGCASIVKSNTKGAAMPFDDKSSTPPEMRVIVYRVEKEKSTV